MLDLLVTVDDAAEVAHRLNAYLDALAALSDLPLDFDSSRVRPWLRAERRRSSDIAAAAGLCGAALGEDTGGSVRSPGVVVRRRGPATHVEPRIAPRELSAVLAHGHSGAHHAYGGGRRRAAPGDGGV